MQRYAFSRAALPMAHHNGLSPMRPSTAVGGEGEGAKGVGGRAFADSCYLATLCNTGLLQVR
jgi:hypothetical protein